MQHIVGRRELRDFIVLDALASLTHKLLTSQVPHAEDGAVEEDVFAAGEFGEKMLKS